MQPGQIPYHLMSPKRSSCKDLTVAPAPRRQSRGRLACAGIPLRTLFPVLKVFRNSLLGAGRRLLQPLQPSVRLFGKFTFREDLQILLVVFLGFSLVAQLFLALCQP